MSLQQLVFLAEFDNPQMRFSSHVSYFSFSICDHLMGYYHKQLLQIFENFKDSEM